MNECLLTLIATPELEERLVDWLLEADHEGFTSARCHGHGLHANRLSTAEQVAGRQRQIAFWLQLPQGKADALIQSLSKSFGGAGLHFWITPVLAAGPITSPASGTTFDASGTDVS